jgi:23S rRNA (adenine2503-C2)-methyltransferase
MKIIRRLTVPTGDILIVETRRGLLEVLSLGDYGKDVNLNQNKEVPDGLPLLPLSEKWVVTLSTQYGCSMGCTFCDVPKVGPGINATYDVLLDQIQAALAMHPEVKHTNRLNVHFARMGEPTWNFVVLDAAADMKNDMYIRRAIGDSLIHPVVSTMMPKNNNKLYEFLLNWMDIKNRVYNGEAGLQLSINSTSDRERNKMFASNAHNLVMIADMMSHMPNPKGRKITLNFAVADYEIDAEKLRKMFDPANFIVKLTPMHKTATALEHGIETRGDYATPYPYEHHAEALRAVGFEVLVFIASRDEDEGKITCGNAILSGSIPHKYEERFGH